MSNTLDEILAPWVGFVHSEYDGTSMVDDELAVIATAKQQLLAEVLDMISSFEVESLPSDDPKLVFWQGYHQAQLDITEAVKERFK